MKKTILNLTALAVITAFTFVACDKKNDAAAPATQEETVATDSIATEAAQAPATDSAKVETPAPASAEAAPAEVKNEDKK